MAKRFTDSEKWKDPWFRKLKGKNQLFWLFVLDTCDHAGIWKDQFDDFCFFTGFKISQKEAMDVFSDRMTKINNESYFVRKFISFQYGKLNPEKNNAHKGVIKSLTYSGISYEKEGAKEGLGRGCLAPQDKEQDKEQDKDKEKDKDKDNKEQREIINELNIASGRSFRGSPRDLAFISARMSEGFKMCDFMEVILFKCDSWRNDEKMNKFLRPETLFGNKFEGYLQESRDAEKLINEEYQAQMRKDLCL